METTIVHPRLSRTCSLAVAFLVIGCAALRAGEKPAAENVNIAKNRNQNSLIRVAAIDKLGDSTEASTLRDNKVVDELTAIAKGDSAKPDDMFVRVAAMKALGRIQLNADKLAKDRFITPFAAVLRDKNEHFLVRKAVAEVFRDTLINEEKAHPDKEAFRALMDIAKNKSDSLGLRCAAIKGVGIFGSMEGLDVLVGLLGEQDPRIREEAAGALFDLLSKLSTETQLPVPAVNKLIEMVGDKKMAPDLRVNVMKVLAQLMREENKQSRQAMPVIIDLVKKSDDAKLVKGGIQALGIIGSAEAVEPLKIAYGDYLKSAAPAPKPDDGVAGGAVPGEKTEETDIRMEIMRALVSVLSFQATKTQPDTKAVHETALLLVKVVDNDPSSGVKEAAVFALRYLYPAKFKVEHREVIDALIFRTVEPGSAEGLKQKIADTLAAITGQDFGLDAARWDEWFCKTYNVKPRAPAHPKAAEPKKTE